MDHESNDITHLAQVFLRQIPPIVIAQLVWEHKDEKDPAITIRNYARASATLTKLREPNVNFSPDLADIIERNIWVYYKGLFG